MSHLSSAKNADLFFNEGLDLLKEKQEGGSRACVFCGQELSVKAEDLINAYSSFFKG